MEYNQNEKELKYSHKPITIDEVQTIMEQMKKYICKIKTKSEIGTGFFCYIPMENKKIPVLITASHLISEKYIEEKKK